MAKLLRARKQFGRCSVPGHGQNHVHINGEGTRHGCCCEVVDDIQGTPFTRAQDKAEAKKEIFTELTQEE
jgi:hypothetical protein